MSFELNRLRLALATMPAAERRVFTLARFESLDLVAIARVLDIEVAEVERRLSRAILHLLEAVSADWP